ncbi:MAG: penicillin-binding protein 2 [Planctomycetota bacterium]
MSSRADKVAMITAGLLVLLMGIVLGRVAQLQLAPSERVTRLVSGRIVGAGAEGVRGDLLDRRGRVLSTTRFSYKLVLDPTLLYKAEVGGSDLGELILKAAEVSGLEAGAIGRVAVEKMAENDRRRALISVVVRPVADATPRSPWSRVGRSIDRLGEAFFAAEPSAQAEQPVGKKQIRYAPVPGLIELERAQAVLAARLPGVGIERVPVREYPGGELAAALIGKVGWDHSGALGAEAAFDAKLRAQGDRTRYVRDARGNPLWVEAGSAANVTRGDAARLTIDLELQRIATDEVWRGMSEADAAAGRAVVINPHTGGVLAMVDLIREVPDAVDIPWITEGEPDPVYDLDNPPRLRMVPDDPRRRVHPSLARNRCVEDVYEPGSTLKPFMWGVITDLGLADIGEVFDTEWGIWKTEYGRPIKDVTRRETMTWAEVLTNSSNIGMIKAGERLTPAQMHAAVERFAFGTPTGIELQGEANGIVTPLRRWSKYTQTSVSFGYELAVTPIQMARSFSLFARRGPMLGTIPDVTIVGATEQHSEYGIVHRALPEETARLAIAPMAATAAKMEGQLAEDFPGEDRWDYPMFGKSGTSRMVIANPPAGYIKPRSLPAYCPEQYHASFIAAGPTNDPQLVVLVIIDDPGPAYIRAKRHYGSGTAGPVVRRIMERSLRYIGVRPELAPTGAAVALAD